MVVVVVEGVVVCGGKRVVSSKETGRRAKRARTDVVGRGHTCRLGARASKRTAQPWPQRRQHRGRGYQCGRTSAASVASVAEPERPSDRVAVLSQPKEGDERSG